MDIRRTRRVVAQPVEHQTKPPVFWCLYIQTTKPTLQRAVGDNKYTVAAKSFYKAQYSLRVARIQFVDSAFIFIRHTNDAEHSLLLGFKAIKESAVDIRAYKQLPKNIGGLSKKIEIHNTGSRYAGFPKNRNYLVLRINAMTGYEKGVVERLMPWIILQSVVDFSIESLIQSPSTTTTALKKRPFITLAVRKRGTLCIFLRS